MGAFSLVPLFAVIVIHVAAQTDSECPALFLRYTKNHSYCKPDDPTCKILQSFPSQEDIEVILKEHNQYRSRIAVGSESRVPSAANMMQLEWDPELAAVAQKHANQCDFSHDCPNCRRVQNYGVGQNLAIEAILNSPTVPKPNWPSAIQSWFDEIEYFSPNFIEPFVPSHGNPTYGHYSQLAWGETWRVGCGYVLFTVENMYKKLYVCNYGPAGNTVPKSMYKVGPPCSDCPSNSCCGESCEGTDNYPGLCKITDDKPPTYSPSGSYLFYCDFQDQPTCEGYVEGTNNWLTYKTLSGNYLGIILKDGEKSTMVFKNTFKPSTSEFCFVINYRKGPNVDGEEEANTATETFGIKSDNFELKENLPSFDGDAKQQFSAYSMSLSWDKETDYKVSFSVPPGKPEQFLEIKSFYVTEGACGDE